MLVLLSYRIGPDVKGAPQNVSMEEPRCGPCLGIQKDVYRGIAQFFAFMAKSEIAAEWQQRTGYLPITKSAYLLGVKQKFYQKTLVLMWLSRNY